MIANARDWLELLQWWFTCGSIVSNGCLIGNESATKTDIATIFA